MTTQTIKSLGNIFEYSTTELKINGVVQSEALHESFNDFLQGAIYTEGHLAGRLNDALFCEFFGVADNTLQTKIRNYYQDCELIKKHIEFENLEDSAFDDLETLEEAVSELIDSVELLACYSGIYFLKEHDFTFVKAFEIAKEAGFNFDNLTSNILGSLLLKDMIKDKFNAKPLSGFLESLKSED